MGVSVLDLWDGQVKIGLKQENAQFSRTSKGNFSNLSPNGKNIPHFTILTQNTPSSLKIEPETEKKCF